MNKPLHTFTNTNEGVESYVWPVTRGGYHVTIRDLDSGEDLPAAVWLEDEDEAIDCAKRCVQ